MHRRHLYSSFLLISLLSFALAQGSPKAICETQIHLLKSQPTTAEIQVIMTPLPGWHAYWINPGDAGDFLSITPSQGKAHLIQASIPQRFSHMGLITYGYEQSASFLYKVSDLNPDQQLVIKADYLLCNDTGCTPQTTETVFDLTSAPTTKHSSDSYHYPQPNHSISILDTSLSDSILTYTCQSKVNLSGWQVLPQTESLRELPEGRIVERKGEHYTFRLELQGTTPDKALLLLRKSATEAILVKTQLEER